MKKIREKVDPDHAASFRCFLRSVTHFDFQWHDHSACELTLILSGCGQRYVADSLERYGPGDLVLLGPNVPHTWASDPRPPTEHQAVVIQFETHFLGRSFWLAPEWQPVRRMIDRAARGLVFEKAEQVAASIEALPEAEPAARLLGLLEALLALTECSERPLASTRSRGQLSESVAHRLDKVCGYLSTHFSEPIRQKQVAELAGMHPAAFSRFFKRATGRTMSQHVTALRLDHAARLLVETDLSVLEVAAESGFENLSYFHRLFRQAHGRSPRRYRLQAAARRAGSTDA
ncbi:MAG: AraC family transcriptional regulator [Phycisphaeraceae bacterium]|nr:AraC family transcriptional regulator [Phycisphaeraceae bacterium]